MKDQRLGTIDDLIAEIAGIARQLDVGCQIGGRGNVGSALLFDELGIQRREATAAGGGG